MMEASAIEEDGRCLQEAEEHRQNTQNMQQVGDSRALSSIPSTNQPHERVKSYERL